MIHYRLLLYLEGNLAYSQEVNFIHLYLVF